MGYNNPHKTGLTATSILMGVVVLVVLLDITPSWARWVIGRFMANPMPSILMELIIGLTALLGGVVATLIIEFVIKCLR